MLARLAGSLPHLDRPNTDAVRGDGAVEMIKVFRT